MVYNDTCISAFHDSIEAAKETYDRWCDQEHPNVDDELASSFTSLIGDAARAWCDLGLTGDAASEAMDSVHTWGLFVAHRVPQLQMSGEMQKSLIATAQEVESRGAIAWLQKLLQDHGTPDPSFNRKTTGPSRIVWGDVAKCKSGNSLLGMCHVSRRDFVAERIAPGKWTATGPEYTEYYKRIFPHDSTTVSGIKHGWGENRTRAVRNVAGLLKK
jgi:hypothetical protein